MTTLEMEIALVDGRKGAFPITRYFVLPRASYGIAGINHECDLLALSRGGYLTEIEIKVSKSDLSADFRKRHAHESPIISAMYYAVPYELVEFAKAKIPERCGLISVRKVKRVHGGFSYYCDFVTKPTQDRKKKPCEKVIAHMYELMSMRYWSHLGREQTRKNMAQSRLSTL